MSELKAKKDLYQEDLVTTLVELKLNDLDPGWFKSFDKNDNKYFKN